MLKIQQYILFEWLKVFFMAAMLMMAMIVLQEMYSRLDNLVEAGASAMQITKVFLLTIPRFLPSIIPMVLLLSVLFSVSSMHRKNEIVAMKAAGMSLWFISKPLLLAATVCAGSILYLNGSLIPWSVQQYTEVRQQIYSADRSAADGVRKEKDYSIKNLGNHNFRENRLWLINRFQPFDLVGEGVTVYQMDENGREQYRLQAERAEYQSKTNDWIFYNGKELSYDGKSDEPYRNRRFEVLEKPEFHDQPNIMVALRKKAKDLSLFELKQVLDNYKGYDAPEIIPYEVSFYRILASPFSCFLVVGFGVPFAVAGVRTNPMIGISKAFGMFILYFVVSNISTILGEGGHISPQLSAAVPLLFIGSFSLRVFFKAQ